MHIVRNCRRGILGAVAATAIAGSVLLVAGPATSSPPSAGRIPETAFQGRSLDMSQVPDFITVEDNAGTVVGYVQKSVLFPEDERPRTDAPIAVYDLETRTRVVGRMHPRRGFVPNGGDPAAHPEQQFEAKELGPDGQWRTVTPRSEPLEPQAGVRY